LFSYTGVVTGNVVLLSLLELRLQTWWKTADELHHLTIPTFTTD